jgi:hypothetical protein
MPFGAGSPQFGRESRNPVFVGLIAMIVDVVREKRARRAMTPSASRVLQIADGQS